MCIAPNMLATGVAVACHECWQCRLAKVNDWVGRCIAESKTVVGSNAITLTYGRQEQDENGDYKATRYGEVDHPRAAVLTYSDVQKYLKKLRFNGYPLRYFVAGEYGSRKGRAHWHIVIFWLEKVPPHEVGKSFMERHWDHGFSFWTKPSYEEFRYNCKYILKGMGDMERQGHLSMSKKPPLGAEYFRRLAEDYAKQGLTPQGSGPDRTGPFVYTFGEALRRNGARHEFHLRDKSLELFLEAFVSAWQRLYGNKEWAASALVDEFADPGSYKERTGVVGEYRRKPATSPLRAPYRQRQMPDWVRLSELDERADDYAKLVSALRRDLGRQLTEPEWLGIMGTEAVRFVPSLNTHVYEAPDGGRWLWRLNQEGSPQWLKSEAVSVQESVYRPGMQSIRRPPRG